MGAPRPGDWLTDFDLANEVVLGAMIGGPWPGLEPDLVLPEFLLVELLAVRAGELGD